MCRLVATIGHQEPDTLKSILEQFGNLAEKGNVPPGTPIGHKDGWGFIAYNNSQISFSQKEPASAFENPVYVEAADQVGKMNPSLLLGHLRKASVAVEKVMENTQPYVFDTYAFCHNGSVYDYETISLDKKYSTHRQGGTDSEMVFLSLIQAIEKKNDFVGGFIEEIKKLRGARYSAMNILMSDGKKLLALREANEKNEDAQKKNLCDDYYTLFRGKNSSGKTTLICSQKLSIPDVTWLEIPNHNLFTIDTQSGEETLTQI